MYSYRGKYSGVLYINGVRKNGHGPRLIVPVSPATTVTPPKTWLGVWPPRAATAAVPPSTKLTKVGVQT
jgi:hypothetical protein